MDEEPEIENVPEEEEQNRRASEVSEVEEDEDNLRRRTTTEEPSEVSYFQPYLEQGEEEEEEDAEEGPYEAEDIPGIITHQNLKDVAHELGLIRLCWEDVRDVDYEGRVHYPWSYCNNSEKEKILLWYAENFRRQYSMKYPMRRPLLLACDNECGIQKMVCTTIRPTTMKYPEFQTWQGCATFVADYIKYETLANPTVLPDRIKSPSEVLRRQSGHSFEYSTLLASFLIGSAYDAYVVCGYATREICFNDRTRIECPFVLDEEEPPPPPEEVKETKYVLKEPNDLRSKFLLEMEARELQKERDYYLQQEEAELEAIREYEKPWPDELWSWRLHSWVLILPSKDVLEPFFIDSVTGVAKSVSDPEYHGIESVWNHLNYWVLVQFQRKTDTCQDIVFELNDTNYWEHLLIGEPHTNRVLPSTMEDADADELEQYWTESEKHLDMAATWVEMLSLSTLEYEMRYPNSHKEVQFRKSVVEQFAAYAHTDGLMTRVTRYHDYECELPMEIQESYANRADLMYFVRKIEEDSSILHKFRRGRDDALKEHYHFAMDAGIEVKFEMKFYDEARLDGLSRLEMDEGYMVEYFEKRVDFLCYKRVDYAERTNPDAPYREILKITETYRRNPEIEASLDVQTVEYFFPERKLHIKFHYEYQHVTQTHREFLKPPAAEMGERLVFDPSLTTGYLTGPTVPEPKPLYLYQLQALYFKKEEVSVTRVRDREAELSRILRLRAQELALPRLLVSVFDVERNQEAKEGFKAREQQLENEKRMSLDLVCDFLAPYYAMLGEPVDSPLGLKEAMQMMEDCLKDWKNLLVARANEIQQQFEEASQHLHEKNNWYERNQGSLSKEQEEEYFDYCKRHIFLLHCLEARLNRHRDMAPQKYLAMEAYLRSDPRLSIIFQRQGRRKRPV